MVPIGVLLAKSRSTLIVSPAPIATLKNSLWPIVDSTIAVVWGMLLSPNSGFSEVSRCWSAFPG
ncbi:hypothetical protein D3874_13350 [Oleomonas cavernae]|uniref:Uncharacterized protein n=1 Tax=Oleomonas cavernae TaxID=2320859 RepID=A0A418WD57_9PROT|nr:hypothetical protein D3874_13350 [Oleomonas cavernae]